MNIQQALKEQYHAGLAMLDECIEKCPDDVWCAGEHPRPFWRIAWHTLYFTHDYLVQDEAAFNDSLADWPSPVRDALGLRDTQRAVEIEPYELPEGVPPLTQREIRDYLAYVRSLVDPTIDHLDLERPDTGFSWYPDMTKLSHELMNLRHLQGHVGQLSELLMARGIDIEWRAKAGNPESA